VASPRDSPTRIAAGHNREPREANIARRFSFPTGGIMDLSTLELPLLLLVVFAVALVLGIGGGAVLIILATGRAKQLIREWKSKG
jgi:hypothetical protein